MIITPIDRYHLPARLKSPAKTSMTGGGATAISGASIIRTKFFTVRKLASSKRHINPIAICAIVARDGAQVDNLPRSEHLQPTILAKLIGRGTHYSVFRATVFHDVHGKPLLGAKFFDFAIIWDEDHDERVLQPVERLYRSGDLPSFIIFGERKGMFFGLVVPRFTQGGLAKGERALVRVCQDVGGDHWTSQLAFRHDPSGIISDDKERVVLYLNTINMLWKLGLKDIVEPEPLEPDFEGQNGFGLT
jgi:hypothetical protein